MTPQPPEPEKKVYFKNFQEASARRLRIPYRSLALLMFVFGVWFALQRSPTDQVVVTDWGMRTIKVGMTEGEVTRILGRPIAVAEGGNGNCYRYGRPTLEKQQFLLYHLCYQDGRVDSIEPEKFNANIVDPAMVPRIAAPEAGSAGGEESSASPSSNPVPAGAN